MSRNSSPPTRRSILAASAAAGAVSLLPMHLAAAGGARPSQPSSEGDSADGYDQSRRNPPLPHRVSAREAPRSAQAHTSNSGPSGKPVTDQSQGVQLATMQELAHYWATDYDWRKSKRS